MKKYIRTERANLFEPNVYISMIVTFYGNLQRNEIEKAVHKAYEANEATMSKIVLKENGDAFNWTKFFREKGKVSHWN